jgi:hypothetical protein
LGAASALLALVLVAILGPIFSHDEFRNNNGSYVGAPKLHKELNSGDSTESLWQKTKTDPVALYTFWLAILTGGLVFVSAIQIGFLFRADETARTAANAAKDLAIAAKIQAGHLKISADVAAEQKILNAQQASDMRASVEQAAKAANATERLAEAALKSAQVAENILLIDNSPLIDITDMALRKFESFPKIPYIEFNIRNNGKGVALIGALQVTITTVIPKKSITHDDKGFTTSEVGAIYPLADPRCIRIGNNIFDESVFDLIKNGQIYLIVGIIIPFVTITGKRDSNFFSFTYDQPKTKFTRNTEVSASSVASNPRGA